MPQLEATPQWWDEWRQLEESGFHGNMTVPAAIVKVLSCTCHKAVVDSVAIRGDSNWHKGCDWLWAMW